MRDLEKSPTNDEINDAFKVLREAQVGVLCNLSLGTVVEVAYGSPDYDPTRYSAAEVRLARALLVTRAALEEVSR